MKIKTLLKIRPFSLILCLLVTGGSFCLGANSFRPVYTDPLLEPWRWQVFPDLSGLGAQCIAEGADGTIWFGASEGAWSFDGVEWTHYPPKDFGGPDIRSICQGADGHVYAAADREISRFNGRHWESLLYESGLIRGGQIRKIAAGGDSTLWAATSRGLLCYRQSRWTLYTADKFAQQLQSRPNPSSGKIELLPEAAYDKMRDDSPVKERCDFSEVCVDAQGRIWLGTEKGEIVCFDPASTPLASNGSSAAKQGKWSVYNETDGMVCGRFPSILATQDGRIWVVYGDNSGHANIFNGKTWSTIDLAEVGVPPDCGNLMQTRDGVIWLSGRYVVAALRDGQWHRYEKPDVPIPSTGNFLLQTADGALWMGGSDTEIIRVDYQTPRWLTLQDLNFQWESPSAEQWFLHRDGRVVVHKADRWISYGAEDGLMDAPVALIGTRDGTVWVAGSHENVAATARYDGRQWTRTVHKEFSWGIDYRGVMESSDGSVWFSATVDSHGPSRHCRGILQYKNGKWIHHHQPSLTPQGGNNTDPATLLPVTHHPEPVGKFYCLGQSGDGQIWAGRNILICRNEKNWRLVSLPGDLQCGTIEAICSTRAGQLWIATQQFGALRYADKQWQAFQGKDSLVANTVRSITETSDGSIWMATDRGFSHYDGHTWTTAPLPEALNIPPYSDGTLKAAASGTLWINYRQREWNYRAWPRFQQAVARDGAFRTVRYQFCSTPPETVITTKTETVSPPGNLAVFWGGSTPWRQLKDSQLQYSYRLDDQDWSQFSPEAGHSFFALSVGRHQLQVRSRDRDFNVDPTPAVLQFAVLPPVWYQGWFITLILMLVGLVTAQTLRVYLERSRLRKLNLQLDQRVRRRTAQLETANKELEAFAYSVSHDLRAPLRGIDGYSQILLEEYREKVDKQGRDYLQRVRAATQRMAQLIDDLLGLSRISRSDMTIQQVDLTNIAQQVAETLRQTQPDRRVEFVIHPNIKARGDDRLLRIVLENLFDNAWKFTSKHPTARIELGLQQQNGIPVYFVRDDGAGFDMNYAQKLFGAFQRLHTTDEFPGTGIGLATIQRIIHRHGGKIWAEGEVEKGAVFYFTIP